MRRRSPSGRTSLLLAAVLLLATVAACSSASVTAAPSPTPAAEETAVVRGTLSDDAVVKKAVRNAGVTIGGIAATVDGQTYEASGVPIGSHVLVVTAPRHAVFRKTVQVTAGENVVDVALGLTVRETYLRYFAAYNTFRFPTAYKMLHPDVRRHHSLTRYTAYMKRFVPYKSIRIVRIRTLTTWRPVYLGKTYRNVKAATRLLGYDFDGSTYTERGVMHWHRIAARWYCIFDWRP